MEIVFASSMDQVIAAAICLNEHQVGGLLEGIEPASAAPVPEPMAAEPARGTVQRHDEGVSPGLP